MNAPNNAATGEDNPAILYSYRYSFPLARLITLKRGQRVALMVPYEDCPSVTTKKQHRFTRQALPPSVKVFEVPYLGRGWQDMATDKEEHKRNLDWLIRQACTAALTFTKGGKVLLAEYPAKREPLTPRQAVEHLQAAFTLADEYAATFKLPRPKALRLGMEPHAAAVMAKQEKLAATYLKGVATRAAQEAERERLGALQEAERQREGLPHFTRQLADMASMLGLGDLTPEACTLVWRLRYGEATAALAKVREATPEGHRLPRDLWATPKAVAALAAWCEAAGMVPEGEALPAWPDMLRGNTRYYGAIGHGTAAHHGHALRLDAATGTLHTTGGVQVPEREARAAWLRVVAPALAKGEAWASPPAEPCAVGSFKLDSIGTEGTLRAGCHLFTRGELLSAAKAFGWPIPAALRAAQGEGV